MPSVSTQNKEVLNLYRHPKLYNGSRFQFYQDANRTDYSTFDEYLLDTEDLPTGVEHYQKDVYYKSISEPITINDSIPNCDEYTYGSITCDNKTYYFFVDGITTDAYKQTTINYTIDWWSTNWSKITCTTAHVIRKQERPLYMQQNYAPLNVWTQEQALTDKYTIFATYIPSTTDVKQYEVDANDKVNELVQTDSFISYILLEGTQENLQKVAQGTWYQELRLAGSDIKDCFIVPFFEISDFMDSSLPPIFTINVESATDRWEAGVLPQRHPGILFKAWYEKYNCYAGRSYDSLYLDSTAYTGNEIIYNEWSGMYYHPVWTEFITQGSQTYHLWKLEPLQYNPIENHQAINYWLY